MSLIHLIDLNEFISTYDYIYGYHIVYLLSGMSCDRIILLFDIFSLNVHFLVEWFIVFQVIFCIFVL